MARACLYSLDENKKIKEERDEFLVLSTIDTINREQIMTANVIFGNHTSVIVPQHNRDNIRKFYCDVLGGEITKADDARDFIRLGEDFYIVLYGDVPDESEFLRTARSVWLEIKSDKVEEMRRKILESGLVRKLEVPDPHLYFQAPGGQCLRLVAIDEDLSFYEGAGAGPDVAKVKEAIKKEQRKTNHNEEVAGIFSVRPIHSLAIAFPARRTIDRTKCVVSLC